MPTIFYIVNIEAVICRDDHYLLARRGPGESYLPGVLTLVGGKVEVAGASDRTFESTLHREIQEEVGIQVEDTMVYLESKSFITSDDNSPVIDVVFLCQYKSGEPKIIDPQETSEICWMTAAEVLNDPSVPPWTKHSISLAEKHRSKHNT